MFQPSLIVRVVGNNWKNEIVQIKLVFFVRCFETGWHLGEAQSRASAPSCYDDLTWCVYPRGDPELHYGYIGKILSMLAWECFGRKLWKSLNSDKLITTTLWKWLCLSCFHFLALLQVGLWSSTQSTQSTARPSWTALVPAPRLRSRSWGSGISGSARIAPTESPTGSRAAPQSPRRVPSPATSLPSPSRSYPTYTWVAPKTPPTSTFWASITSSTSWTSHPTSPTCSSTTATSGTNRSPFRTTGVRTSRSSSRRPYHSLVSKVLMDLSNLKTQTDGVWLSVWPHRRLWLRVLVNWIMCERPVGQVGVFLCFIHKKKEFDIAKRASSLLPSWPLA